eukprot:7737768-Lingulodinium_polyedra.AAC.1
MGVNDVRMCCLAKGVLPEDSAELGPVRVPGDTRPIGCSNTCHKVVMKCSVVSMQPASDVLLHSSQEAKK